MAQKLTGILAYFSEIKVDLPSNFNIVTGDPTRYRRNFHLPYRPPILLAETILDGRKIIRFRETSPEAVKAAMQAH